MAAPWSSLASAGVRGHPDRQTALAGGDECHDDVDSTFEGWTDGFRVLHMYLTHFAGLPVTTLLVQHELPSSDNVPDAVDAAGLRTGEVGDKVGTTPPAPPLSGVLEHAGDDAVIVRTSELREVLVSERLLRLGS